MGFIPVAQFFTVWRRNKAAAGQIDGDKGAELCKYWHKTLVPLQKTQTYWITFGKTAEFPLRWALRRDLQGTVPLFWRSGIS